MVSWNLLREARPAAAAFEAAGRPVLVTENASWGNDFEGGRWLTLARGVHNTSGRFPDCGPDRWDSMGVELAPWRVGGDEIVILPQRGIGPPGVAMPQGWLQQAKTASGGRIRPHPGNRPAARSLQADLARAIEVWTWGSGAAVMALLFGIPVRSFMPNWIAEQNNTDEGRLAMFRRLAWAQWRLAEIKSGEAFDRLFGWVRG